MPSRKNAGPAHSLPTEGSISESNKQRVTTSNTWGRPTAAAKLLHLTLRARSDRCGARKAGETNNSRGRWGHGRTKPSPASSLHLPRGTAEGGSQWASLRSPQALGCEPALTVPTATRTRGWQPAAGLGKDVGASSPYLGGFSAPVPQAHRCLTTEVRNTGKADTQSARNTPAPQNATFPAERATNAGGRVLFWEGFGHRWPRQRQSRAGLPAGPGKALPAAASHLDGRAAAQPLRCRRTGRSPRADPERPREKGGGGEGGREKKKKQKEPPVPHPPLPARGLRAHLVPAAPCRGTRGEGARGGGGGGHVAALLTSPSRPGLTPAPGRPARAAAPAGGAGPAALSSRGGQGTGGGRAGSGSRTAAAPSRPGAGRTGGATGRGQRPDVRPAGKPGERPLPGAPEGRGAPSAARGSPGRSALLCPRSAHCMRSGGESSAEVC